MLYKHNDAASQIEVASRAGCFICGILWDRLTEEEKDLIRREDAKKLQAVTVFDSIKHGIAKLFWFCAWWIFYRFIFDPEIKRVLRPNEYAVYGWTADYDRGEVTFDFGTFRWKEITFKIKPNDEAMHENGRRVNMLPTPGQGIDELIAASPIPKEMGSASVWDLVQQWYANCSPFVSGHSQCHEHQRDATSAIPTRLLDVMAGEDKNQVRLTVSAQERERLPYVTLSYSWGGIDQSKLFLLRQNTLHAYRVQIPEGHLPALFKETIDIVRKLQFRYIWIDAYCIIQQDSVDFQAEAACMGEIYQHAALNIAAGGAQNPFSRLLGSRDATLIGRPPDMPRFAAGTYYVFELQYIYGEVLETPLNRRAWVFQEQQLSPRILHFGKSQIFWRCWGEKWSLHQACETFPMGTPRAPGFERAHGYGQITALPDTIRQTNDLNYNWTELVAAYSRTEITIGTDRLIALSGLAASYADALKQDSTDYAAGLWRCGLPFQLYWQVDISPIARGRRSTRYKDYVGPSWSWVSVNGYARFFYQMMNIEELSEEGFKMRSLCGAVRR
ncbi:hypothetical protein LTR10_018275 [Elasticomyces elasticus]|uniref:Heterokaryon incompatibility domain-containing protein n=1 Tax=Exophiala sideris TaxID=1016849 RepID=A0ABR0JJ28_9EURO|nr:hypothetical protein LTR10_018275 [Elasticomyces elasticus]KAK5034483.1 hypothetical protein LTS07_003404 [Exophiala sideris]KAK5042779.1 hypothetical protein LTR13_001627 [Exophiala sideris]KAK5065862.1 hypothetical protein LTR69_003412 [Exophiala sideris]KAK5185676.1 hypothetical protein LTR44_001725 [Eurotiomycetes sp. CCFEE 6388]